MIIQILQIPAYGAGLRRYGEMAVFSCSTQVGHIGKTEGPVKKKIA